MKILILILFIFETLNPVAYADGVSINPAAAAGNASQSGGAGANNAAGAALISAGSALMSQPPTVPMGMALMAMGLMALMQGAHDSNAAGQSANTGSQSVALGSGGGNGGSGNKFNDGTAPGGPASVSDNGKSAVFKTPAAQSAIAAIQNAGGNVSGDGITLPNGQFKPWSAFSSESSMNAAGFDGKSLMKIAGDVEKKVESQGSFSSDPSGTSGGGASSPTYDAGTDFKFKNPFALSPEAKAKLIEGKTVQINGTAIGVAGDNIFAIIHRAYQRKVMNDEFINEPAVKVGNFKALGR